MDGIHILNKIEVGKVGWPNIMLMLFCLICIVLLVVLLAIHMDNIVIVIITLIGIVVFICLIPYALTTPINETLSYYQYECTIDETVSLADIYEKYEVIEQRGEIWVLEEKEVVDDAEKQN